MYPCGDVHQAATSRGGEGGTVVSRARADEVVARGEATDFSKDAFSLRLRRCLPFCLRGDSHSMGGLSGMYSSCAGQERVAWGESAGTERPPPPTRGA